jgi:hypothetical protein
MIRFRLIIVISIHNTLIPFPAAAFCLPWTGMWIRNKVELLSVTAVHSMLFQCLSGYCAFEGFSKHEATLTPGACVIWYSP